MRFDEIPIGRIKTYEDLLDWDAISKKHTLSEDFIREFKDRVNWEYISQTQILSEEIYQIIIDRFIITNHNDFNFVNLTLEKYNFSKEFLFKNADFLKSSYNIYKQKEIMYLYGKIDWIDANKIFLLNNFITHDDINILFNKLDIDKILDHHFDREHLSSNFNYRLSDLIKTLKENNNE